MDEARRLARFARELRYDELPKEVIDKAKELILDQVGCELAGSTLPWSKATYEYIRDDKGQREESTVVNYGLRTTVQDAAFANANFGRGGEVDDIDEASKSHLGSIIIPAALAIGEREMISVKEFIKAVVVGYDVASRIGAATPLAMSRGFHSTAIFGPFGAAAATSIILGLDEDEILNALSIAASHSSGLMEYSESGGSVNRLHAGIAAYGGIRASFLAQRGFSGPATILEGKKGVCQAFSSECSLEEIARGLGKEFRILGIGLRQYCGCGTQNAGIDAISTIISEHAIAPKEIEDIIVGAPTSVLRMVSTIIEPKDITSAQFSGRFGIALRLIKGGNGFREYTEENLRDPDILSLVGKIKYILDEDLEKASTNPNPTKVTIRLRDGTVYEETVYAAKGSIQNPMTKEELHNKFREFASMVLPDYQVGKIIETVEALDRLDNIRDLMQLLVAS